MVLKKVPPQGARMHPEKSSAGILYNMPPSGQSRTRTLRKKIIKIYSQKKLSQNDKDLAWIHAQELMKSGGKKSTRKILNTSEGRDDYITYLYQKETKAMKKDTENIQKMNKTVQKAESQ